MRIINRTIWILSLVSLIADVASEMLYPVIPLYLKEIGFSVLLIGILEGFVNFTAGISKGYFGAWSDRKGLRLPFVRWGYFLSALSKPLMAAFPWHWWVFLARSTDRLGKGVRTAARDALLAQETSPEFRGRVFGFHRSMDTFGAAIGPVLALAFLFAFPGQYSSLFYWAFLPGMLSVAMTFWVKEKQQPVSLEAKGNFLSYFRYWNQASLAFKKAMPGFLLFAFFNSADIFLLLLTRQQLDGQQLQMGAVLFTADTLTIGVYIFYNLVYAVASYPLGALADRLGTNAVIIGGMLVYALVYAGFAMEPGLKEIIALFFLYGIYAAATEGVIKAWVSNNADSRHRATAIGFYTSCESIAALAASIIAGVVWSNWGAAATFAVPAFAAVLAASWLFYQLNSKPISSR
jgi:MFS family permease